MGKKTGPAPPPAPDPIATAQAQTQSNKETAIANANLNRIDQYSPWGSLTYSQTGTNPDGTPAYRQDTSLSPAQQAILDSQNSLDLGLNQFASGQLGRVQNAMGTGIDMSSAPALRGGLNTAGLPGLRPPSQAPTTLKLFETGQDVQGQVGGQNYQTGYSSGGPIQNSYSSGGPIQGIIGTTADRMNGTIADVGSSQRTINGSMPALYGGNVQSALDYSGLTALPGTDDFGAERTKVEDAMYGRSTARLDPRFATDQRALETRLTNMGIARGSQAWNREMDSFGRTKNDAYSSAMNDSILAGGNEQSRLFGLAMGARQQGQNEVNSRGQFANAADQQMYNYALGNRQQMFGEASTRANLYNQAQAQDFAQRAQRAQFANQTADAQFAQNLAAGQFANQAQAQQYGQNASSAAFANQAQAQQYGQNRDAATFANDARKAQFDQSLAQGEFANNAAGQQFQQGAARTAFYNDAINQDFANDNLAFSSNAAARAQLMQEQQTDAALSNAARQQYMQENAYLRNLPIQDIAALLGTSGGVQQPTFSSVPGVNQAGTDVMGAIYNSYNGQMNAWQQQQAARANTMGQIFGSLGSIGGAIAMSDRNVKHAVKRMGQTAAGIPTYVFSYFGSKARHFGVMAQEVLHIPGAVTNDNGLYYVNYGKVW